MVTSSPPEAGTVARPVGPGFSWNPFADAQRPRGPTLLAHGPGGERRIELPIGWSTLGSSARAEIRLEHPEVSRIHARIIRDSDEIVHVIDDRSLTGVFVNGRRVRCAELESGDELEVGPYRMVLRAGAALPRPIA